MKNNKIKNSLIKTGHKIRFGAKKYSPEICMIAGIVGVAVSAVMACNATLKAEKIIKKTKDDIEKIESIKENEEIDDDTYSEDDAINDTALVYVQTGVKLAGVYAPAIIIGFLSITSLITSNRISRKRNIALSAAYTAIERSYKSYRKRVVERFGEQTDKELRYNIKNKGVKVTTVDENGEETTSIQTVKYIDDIGYSDYAKIFDKTCKGWRKDPESSLRFLKCQQSIANDILQAKGYLFLNTVYDMLGIPRTEAGQIVGWIYDKKNPIGDNYVDFGIYDLTSCNNAAFVNGYARNIVLDFNVDGNILSVFGTGYSDSDVINYGGKYE